MAPDAADHDAVIELYVLELTARPVGVAGNGVVVTLAHVPACGPALTVADDK